MALIYSHNELRTKFAIQFTLYKVKQFTQVKDLQFTFNLKQINSYMVPCFYFQRVPAYPVFEM